MIFTYNKIVRNKNKVEVAFNDIDIQLKKRFDAIPNIVAVLKKYLAHEETIFTQVADLRTVKPVSNEKVDAAMQQKVSAWLASVQMTMENYPELKSNESVMLLQRSINEYAEQIAASQRIYNQAVLTYNNSVTVFPNNIVAKMFNFKKQTTLNIITEAAKENPNLSTLL